MIAAGAAGFADPRLWVGGALLALGALLSLIAALGVLRLPDVYARLHAAALGRAPAATLILAGLAVLAWDGWTTLRLAFLWALVWAIGPMVGFIIGNAAHGGGVAPVSGPHRAPRPQPRRPGRPSA